MVKVKVKVRVVKMHIAVYSYTFELSNLRLIFLYVGLFNRIITHKKITGKFD